LKALDSKGGTKLSDQVAYDDWEFGTRAEMRRRGALEIALGNETRPFSSDNSKAVKAWIANHDVATAMIVGRLDHAVCTCSRIRGGSGGHVGEVEGHPPELGWPGWRCGYVEDLRAA
jgi:hypothetical protein